MGLLSTFGAATARAYGFTRSAIAQAVDAYFNRVTLLLPGNGTNGAQNNTFLDSGTANGGVGFTITRNPSTGPNAPTQGTFSPFSQTGWSGFFDGTGDYVTVANNADFQFGTGDFTVEYWVYFTSALSTTTFLPLACWAANSGYELYYRGASPAGFAWYYNSSILTTGFVPASNRWYHVACTRASGTTRVFVDGAIQATLNSDTSNLSPTTSLILGAETATTGTTFPGYISNVRVIKGAAAYTSAFTPSTTNLGIFGSGTTSLLTLQSNRFIDNGSNPKTVTPTNAAIQAFSPFAPTAAYSAATNGGSGYFDGTGDFLTAANATSLDLSTGDFTVEAFFYVTTSSGNQAIVARNNGNISTGNDAQYAIFITSGNIYVRPYSSTTDYSINLGSVPVNQWCHVALVRTGNTFYGYLNGARNATTQTISGSLNNSTWSTYVGQYSVSSAAWPFSGYISQVRILKGTAQYTTATITVPTSPLTAITNTSLLLNFTNAGITDATAKNVLETVGNAQISTTQSKFGGSSISIPSATGDYCIAHYRNLNFPDITANGQNFTIEAWIFINTFSSTQNTICGTRANGTAGWEFRVNPSGTLQMYNTGGSSVTTTTTITTGVWYYVAAVKSSGTLTIYINGTSGGGAGTYGNATATTNNLFIGNGNAANTGFNGYIDDLRITQGFARTITTPTSAFPVQ